MEVKKTTGSAGIGSLEDLFVGTLDEGDTIPKDDLVIPPVDPDKPTLEFGEELDANKNGDNNKESSLTDEEKTRKEEEERIAREEKLNSEKQNPIQSEGSEQYRESLKRLFGKRVETITILDENEQEVEVSLDEVDLDLETYESIAKQYMDIVKEESAVNKISVEGISEFTKALIEIEKNGGNTLELLQMKEELSDPLENLDLNKRDDQIKAIFLRQRAQGIDDDDTKMLIRGYEAEGVLEDKAKNADAQLREAIKKRLELEQQQTQAIAAQREEEFKQYKKNFREGLNTFELNDTSKTKLVDFALRKNSDNRYEIDKAYSEAKRNPEKAVKLALFLKDYDEFVKQVTNEKVKETKLETAKKIRIIKGTQTSVGDPQNKKESKGLGNLAELM